MRVYELPVGLLALQAVAAPEAPQDAVIFLQGPNVSVPWSGRNAAGQAVAAGGYYMVVRSTNAYSQATTQTIALNVVRATSGVRISIYNSAGEQVAFHQASGLGSGLLRLDKEQIAPDPGSGRGVEIRWGSSAQDTWVWDGANAHGQAVTTGIYSVVVERQESGKAPSTITASVAVVAAPGKALLEGSLAAPNPATALSPRIRFIAPSLSMGARFNVDIYNVAGELIVHLSGATPDLAWELGGLRASGGIYLARLSALGADGRLETRVIKVALAQ